MKKFFIAAVLSLSIIGIKAATIDTLRVYSNLLQKETKAIVVSPSNTNKPMCVVYLLHGYGGNYTDWTKNTGYIAEAADMYQFIVVCPDGNTGSWYFDSPINPGSKYESYMIKELVPAIDSKYNTIKNRSGRAITGLSMGGHGALYLAIRNQDIFGAAGSTSGGVDIRPFPNNWDLPLLLGKIDEHRENWEANTVINLTPKLNGDHLKLIFDCGTEDFFYEVNKALHADLLAKKIPHDYIERPGSHNWNYWNNSIKYQLLFFSNVFKKCSN